MNNVPRRARLYEMTPAELAIAKCVDQVEELGAHVHLTDAVVLLGKAREKVADFVDSVPVAAPSSAPPTQEPTFTKADVERLRNPLEVYGGLQNGRDDAEWYAFCHALADRIEALGFSTAPLPASPTAPPSEPMTEADAKDILRQRDNRAAREALTKLADYFSTADSTEALTPSFTTEEYRDREYPSLPASAEQPT